LLLSLTGSALGVFLAGTAIHYFRILNPIAMPPGNPITMNLTVLAFTSFLAVVTTLLFGLIPAFKASRIDLMNGLRLSAQTATFGRGARNLRRGLVTIEVALSLALSVAAGLLIQSVQHLASVPLGFRTDHVTVAQIVLPRWTYSASEQRASFFRRALTESAGTSNGVLTAFASGLPPDGLGGAAVSIEGRPDPDPGDDFAGSLQVSVSPAYFTVMGEPLTLGRVFDDSDGERSQPVAVVNDSFVRKYFPRQDPIGKRIQVSGAPGSEAGAPRSCRPGVLRPQLCERSR